MRVCQAVIRNEILSENPTRIKIIACRACRTGAFTHNIVFLHMRLPESHDRVSRPWRLLIISFVAFWIVWWLTGIGGGESTAYLPTKPSAIDTVFSIAPKRLVSAIGANIALQTEVASPSNTQPLRFVDDGITSLWNASYFDDVVRSNTIFRASLWSSTFRGVRNPDASASLGSSASVSKGHVLNALSSIRQCRVLGAPALEYIARYIESHQTLNTSRAGGSQPQVVGAGRLIYSCESNKRKHFCGGMGDRFRGIISSFYMALLSNRRFEIYSPVPVALQKYLRPNLLNWIPSMASTSSSDMKAAVDMGISSIPSDLSLMSIKKHSSYLRKLDGFVIERPARDSVSHFRLGNRDLRLQTNSVGIDAFLSHSRTPRLSKNKEIFFAGKALSSGGGGGHLDGDVQEAFSNKHFAIEPTSLSAKQVAELNISTYFGCLYEILFTPTDTVLSAAAEVLGASQQQTKPATAAYRIIPSAAVKDERVGSTFAGIAGSLFESPRGIGAPSSTPEHLLSANWDRLVMGSPLMASYGQTIVSSARPVLALLKPFVSLQVRVGGALAKGMREPYRTPPAAFEDILDMVGALLSASAQIAPQLTPWDLFVSSDAEAFIDTALGRFGRHSTLERGDSGPFTNVRMVNGTESFLHTDTLNLGDIDASRWAHVSSATKEKATFLTLLNNYLLGLGSHMVMAQSGFGDTAFWRMHREASCLFVDMNGLRIAWQHHLAYGGEPSDSFSRAALPSRLERSTTVGFVEWKDDHGVAKKVPVLGGRLAPASSTLNRIFEVGAPNAKRSFYQ